VLLLNTLHTYCTHFCAKPHPHLPFVRRRERTGHPDELLCCAGEAQRSKARQPENRRSTFTPDRNSRPVPQPVLSLTGKIHHRQRRFTEHTQSALLRLARLHPSPPIGTGFSRRVPKARRNGSEQAHDSTTTACLRLLKTQLACRRRQTHDLSQPRRIRRRRIGVRPTPSLPPRSRRRRRCAGDGRQFETPSPCA
jgi:hypothetical protein